MKLVIKKEYVRNKTKYLLISLILILLTALMTLLDGLSEGLSTGMNGALTQAKGDVIMMDDSAEGNLNRSVLPIEISEWIHGIPATLSAAPIGYYSNSAHIRDDTSNVSFFGVFPDTIGEPDLIDGSHFSAEPAYEAVVDESFLEEHGLEIGDSFELNELDEPVTITGTTHEQRFSMQPSVFIHLDLWRNTREEMEELATYILIQSHHDQTPEETASALNHITEGEFNILPTETAAAQVAGVSEMSLIPALLKWLTFVIALSIISVFTYILVLQKESMIRIMKAMGAPRRYLSLLFSQLILYLILTSTLIGNALSYFIQYMMPPSLSIRIDMFSLLETFILIIVFSLVGLIFALRAIHKMPEDPDLIGV